MGNISLLCCRVKSPRLAHLCSESNHSPDKLEHSFNCKRNSKRNLAYLDHNLSSSESSRPLSILQHISEREPDDSATDPSSNPFDKPIFASRTCPSPKARRERPPQSSQVSPCLGDISSKTHRNKLLTSSIDHGYSSTPTYNNTDSYYENGTDSFDGTKSFDNDVSLRDDLSESKSASTPKATKENMDGSFSFMPTIANKAETITLNKSSSCSTIFLDDSSISQPNFEATVKCVSLAIYYHIKNRSSDYCLEIFDETIHPLAMPKSSDKYDPGEQFTNDSCDQLKRTICLFVRTLFSAASLTSEYAITTLVYLERLMTYAELDLAPKSWRRMFLGATLLSSKVWEDQAVWNVDYAQILDEISVEDINELERQFLELIQFNMNVPSSIYAKYYFHLRSLAFEHDLTGTKNILTVDKARTLEVSSRN